MADIVGTKEAARMIGISQRAVLALIERGTLKAERLGREWVIARKKVLAYKAKKEKRER